FSAIRHAELSIERAELISHRVKRSAPRERDVARGVTELEVSQKFRVRLTQRVGCWLARRQRGARHGERLRERAGERDFGIGETALSQASDHEEPEPSSAEG